MKRERFKEHIKENKWLIGAVIFFILWKFFLIHILWQGRFIPPEPDDSHNYIMQIAAITDCKGLHFCSYPGVSMEDSTGYVYLSYRLFFGLLAKITQIPPQTIYHFGFYLGTLFLVFALYPFLRNFSSNKNLITWSIFFLSFYHGLGETHGFYWVVPSFFSVLLFFILASYLIRDDIRFKTWAIVLLAIMFVFSHPMSVFLIFIIPLYLFILSLFTRRIDRTQLKRIFFTVSIVLLASLISSASLSSRESKKNTYSVKETILQVQSATLQVTENSATEGDSITPKPEVSKQKDSATEIEILSSSKKMRVFHNVYFRWIFPHWVFIVPFLLCFFILLHKRQFKIISFYLASLVFFFFATLLNPMGYRSAIILWPITYILFAFSGWYLIEIIREKTSGSLKNIILGILYSLICLFFLVNAAFAFVFNENLNIRNNYSAEPGLTEYLLNTMPPGQSVALPVEFILTEPTNISPLQNRLASYETDPDYIVVTNPIKIPSRDTSRCFKIIKQVAEKFGFYMHFDATPIYVKPDGYTHEKEFGIFDIYKRLPETDQKL